MSGVGPERCLNTEKPGSAAPLGGTGRLFVENSSNLASFVVRLVPWKGAAGPCPSPGPNLLARAVAIRVAPLALHCDRVRLPGSCDGASNSLVGYAALGPAAVAHVLLERSQR